MNMLKWSLDLGLDQLHFAEARKTSSDVDAMAYHRAVEIETRKWLSVIFFGRQTNTKQHHCLWYCVTKALMSFTVFYCLARLRLQSQVGTRGKSATSQHWRKCKKELLNNCLTQGARHTKKEQKNDRKKTMLQSLRHVGWMPTLGDLSTILYCTIHLITVTECSNYMCHVIDFCYSCAILFASLYLSVW